MYVKDINEAMLALQEQVNLLKEKADDVIQTPVKLIPYKIPDEFNHRIEAHFATKGFLAQTPSTIEQVDRLENLFNEKYQKVLTEIRNTHELNIPIVDRNQKIKDKVTLVMKTIGVYETYNTYAFKTVRSRERSPIRHHAGYVGDLDRCVPTNDTYLSIKQNIDNKAQQVKEHAKKLRSEIYAKNKKVEEEKKHKEKNSYLMFLAGKYQLSKDVDNHAVFEAILDKDKYLRLYDALFEARTNYDEGYHKVKQTLPYLDSKNELDVKILKKLKHVLEHWDGDGKVFRDSDVGYGVVRKLIKNDDLFKDYETFRSHIENELNL